MLGPIEMTLGSAIFFGGVASFMARALLLTLCRAVHERPKRSMLGGLLGWGGGGRELTASWDGPGRGGGWQSSDGSTSHPPMSSLKKSIKSKMHLMTKQSQTVAAGFQVEGRRPGRRLPLASIWTAAPVFSAFANNNNNNSNKGRPSACAFCPCERRFRETGNKRLFCVAKK